MCAAPTKISKFIIEHISVNSFPPTLFECVICDQLRNVRLSNARKTWRWKQQNILRTQCIQMILWAVLHQFSTISQKKLIVETTLLLQFNFFCVELDYIGEEKEFQSHNSSWCWLTIPSNRNNHSEEQILFWHVQSNYNCRELVQHRPG